MSTIPSKIPSSASSALPHATRKKKKKKGILLFEALSRGERSYHDLSIEEIESLPPQAVAKKLHDGSITLKTLTPDQVFALSSVAADGVDAVYTPIRNAQVFNEDAFNKFFFESHDGNPTAVSGPMSIIALITAFLVGGIFLLAYFRKINKSQLKEVLGYLAKEKNKKEATIFAEMVRDLGNNRLQQMANALFKDEGYTVKFNPLSGLVLEREKDFSAKRNTSSVKLSPWDNFFARELPSYDWVKVWTPIWHFSAFFTMLWWLVYMSLSLAAWTSTAALLSVSVISFGVPWLVLSPYFAYKIHQALGHIDFFRENYGARVAATASIVYGTSLLLYIGLAGLAAGAFALTGVAGLTLFGIPAIIPVCYIAFAAYRQYAARKKDSKPAPQNVEYASPDQCFQLAVAYAIENSYAHTVEEWKTYQETYDRSILLDLTKGQNLNPAENEKPGTPEAIARMRRWSKTRIATGTVLAFMGGFIVSTFIMSIMAVLVGSIFASAVVTPLAGAIICLIGFAASAFYITRYLAKNKEAHEMRQLELTAAESDLIRNEFLQKKLREIEHENDELLAYNKFLREQCHLLGMAELLALPKFSSTQRLTAEEQERFCRCLEPHRSKQREAWLWTVWGMTGLMALGTGFLLVRSLVMDTAIFGAAGIGASSFSFSHVMLGLGLAAAASSPASVVLLGVLALAAVVGLIYTSVKLYHAYQERKDARAMGQVRAAKNLVALSEHAYSVEYAAHEVIKGENERLKRAIDSGHVVSEPSPTPEPKKEPRCFSELSDFFKSHKKDKAVEMPVVSDTDSEGDKPRASHH